MLETTYSIPLDYCTYLLQLIHLFPGTEFELDLWRFRLPESTRPELASAGYYDGELVVTVPKGAAAEDDDGGDIGGGRLVLVQ